jgi:serine/threonine-protein kinase RsbT
VATIVSELARNIFMYTDGGTIDLVPTAEGPPRLLVRAVDRGRGIAHLDEVMSGRYRSKTGLGAGLLGTKRLVDRFEIETGPTGTRVEAEVAL